MKNLIIIIGTIVLACIISVMILGDNNSLKSASKGVMVDQIQTIVE